MTHDPEEFKRLTDRAKLVLDYITEERVRCTGLIMAIDDRDFLLYCIHDACCQPSEIDHWRTRYNEFQPSAPLLAASQHAGREPPETSAYEGAGLDVEDLM